VYASCWRIWYSQRQRRDFRLPADAEDVSRVTNGNQPITSMSVCVDWSLGYMTGVIDSDKIRELNDNTKCETERYNTYVSLYHMLGWVTTTKYEPYGI
jgi:hypothetical protein